VPSQSFCAVAFSDGKPVPTFPENAPSTRLSAAALASRTKLACLLFGWCSLTDSNRRMSGCRPDAFAAWRREHVTGAPRRTRTCNMPLLRRPPLPIGLPARTRGRLRTCTFQRLRPGLFRLGYAGEIGAPGEIRTRTTLVLSEMPPANWATGAWCSLQASILPPPTYQIGALPNELRERIGAPCTGSNLRPALYKSAALPLS
jgi:hypothetical protein